MQDENAILEYWRAINAGEINAGKWIKLLYEVILEGLREELQLVNSKLEMENV